MRFVDEHQRIGRQVVDQRRRRFARLAPGKMPRVVLDPFAESELVEHFEVETRPLLEPLRFDQLAFLLELRDALAKFALYRLDCTQNSGPRRDVVRRGKDGEAEKALMQMPGQRIEELQVKGKIRL